MKSAVALALAISVTASIAQTAAAPDRFDGNWSVRIDCPSNSEPSGAKGYVFEFPATVTKSFLSGTRGEQSAPGYLHIEGVIQPDGTAELRADGRTGNPDFAVRHPASGSTFTYQIAAQFESTKGTGQRLKARVCTFGFSKL
ncbi:MAG: hypothetical protein ABI218_12445 [Caldimonas sp.]